MLSIVPSGAKIATIDQAAAKMGLPAPPIGERMILTELPAKPTNRTTTHRPRNRDWARRGKRAPVGDLRAYVFQRRI